MGRLLPQELPWSRKLGLLWEEVRDGTLVWRQPTESEAAASRARRAELFRASNVPWIVTDIGGLLGAYDNLQDVMSFTNWNRKVYAPGAFRDCVAGQAASGVVGMAAATACACPFGRSGKRLVASSGSGWGFLLQSAVFGFPFAAALKLFPPVAGVMWGLLAGQVAMSLFGVGLRLGPIVAASQELTYGALAALGFPFGVDRNKSNQLRRSRAIREGDRILGASAYLDAGDRVLAAQGLAFAYRDVHPAPEVVIDPRDYPNTGNLLRDPWGTVRAAASLASSLLPNAVAFAVNDLVAPAVQGMARLVGGQVPASTSEPSPATRAAMLAIHRQKCPRSDACRTGVADYLRFLELLGGLGSQEVRERMVQNPDGSWERTWIVSGPDVERITLGVDDTIWGGLFRPVSGF